ncbi:MAG: hypothetical protein U0800_08150 [Isosphaeraceae bacterium]
MLSIASGEFRQTGLYPVRIPIDSRISPGGAIAHLAENGEEASIPSLGSYLRSLADQAALGRLFQEEEGLLLWYLERRMSPWMRQGDREWPVGDGAKPVQGSDECALTVPIMGEQAELTLD